MKEGGYATHMVGKWDARMATSDHTPKGRGFDSSLSYFYHANDYYTEQAGECNKTRIVDLWDTDKPASNLNGTGPDNYEDGLFKERVLDIIRNHDPSTTLFLYYAPHIVHTPYQVRGISWQVWIPLIFKQTKQAYLQLTVSTCGHSYLDRIRLLLEWTYP